VVDQTRESIVIIPKRAPFAKEGELKNLSKSVARCCFRDGQGGTVLQQCVHAEAAGNT
jgi:hypothetical protein